VLGAAVVYYWINFGHLESKVILSDYYKLGNELNWVLFGIPSSAILSVLVLSCYHFLVRKKKKIKGADNIGETD